MTTSAAAAAVVLTPLVLASISQARYCWHYNNARKRRRRKHQKGGADDTSSSSSFPLFASALYKGRVWHTRCRPVVHKFSYPIFLFRLDLEELDALMHQWWPLTWIMSFREDDHLKNNEGRESNDDDNTHSKDNSLLTRVLRLVAERTNHSFVPTRETHRVLLLTQLRYYGYCFNPVSFYYIIHRQTHTIEAVVGEVSNTPWLEMHAYVLHPDSVDQVQVVSQEADHISDNNNNNSHHQSSMIRYRFPKAFHVSPFMEMMYWYDWTFDPQMDHNADRIRVVNAMQVRNNSNDDNNSNDNQSHNNSSSTTGPLQFRATLHMTRYSLQSAFTVVPSLIVYPMFGMIVQGWIHYQALWLLFVKKVDFCPHPQGAETTVSRLIASIMAPVFAVQEWWNNGEQVVVKKEERFVEG